jgi:peptide/nickel transport system substrate-binding protein
MTGPFTPDQWAYNPEVPVLQYNPAEAQRILSSLGWLDTNGDGILEKDGKPFRVEMLITGGNSPSAPFAQLFQAELKKIGVQLDVTTLDPSAFIQRILAGNYGCAYLSWDLDPDPDPFALFHSSQIPPRGQNIVFFANAQADRLLEAARLEFKQSERVKLYRQFHALLAEEQPYTWTIQVSSKWALRKRVHNVKDSKGWGLFGWYPGELGWWIPRNQRRPDTAAKR